jgi:2-polyprenyl-3-methyl-5-hydroxy-6-metoxy-1,4-benzoquinol methylase
MTCAHKDYEIIYKFGAISCKRCNICELIFSEQHRSNFDPKRVYENYYKNEVPTRFHWIVEYVIKLFRFFRAFKIFTVHPGATSILDIGSGRGFTLHFLKKYYKFRRTAGTQLSSIAAQYAQATLGLEIYDKDLLQTPFSNNSFDVVTIWHVLEHVLEPGKYIEKVADLLAPDGKLIVEVPNFNSWSRKLTGKYWLGLDLNYHLFFFTPRSLSLLLENCGFKIMLIHTFSLEYSTFISAQSILSRITKTDNLFFRSLESNIFTLRTILHGFLISLLIPACFFINVVLYFSRSGEVLFIVAEKNQ